MSIPILRLDNLSLAYGHVALLEGVALQIDESERVCLVGRNGTGKSTLVRILAGEVVPDDGQVWRRPGLRIAYLSQEVPVDEQRSVFDVVAGGLAEVGDLLAEYHRTAVELAGNPSPRLVERLATLQHELEAGDGWRLEQRVESVLSRLGLPADRPLSELSGGVRRRVLLARALVGEPDLLLLDEPTNHLDIDGITWLEDFLQGYNGALLFITHDRAFLRRLASRIVELDRGYLTSWPGDYDAYLRKREERLAVEAEHQARFDKKLAEEETWIRQGIKARRTRNEGRVRALEALRAERRQRRERMGRANMRLDDGEQSGRLVAELEHVTVSLDGRPVIRDLSTTILRGDRVGIIGPNGAGKTTLLKVILGEFKPDAGTVRLGTRLQTAYFDQQRARLDPERSVIGSLELGGDTVTVGDQTRHVISYLQDFLFPPARARSPVKSLSGGERNRLLLARLFTRPANLLVLDEPTNDLDVETLELLEERLTDYRGTLLLVSHDRAFLDNVVTSTLVFEGNGRVAEYVGGYEDWMRQRPATQAVGVEQKAAPPVEKTAPANVPEPNRPRKLGYKEQRELVALPQRIEALEAEQEQLHQAMADPAFYRRDSAEISAAKVRLEALETELAEAYRRWEALESGPG